MPEKLIDPYPNTTLASTAMLQGVTDDANQKKVAVEKLKALYGWADETLIEDVLVAVNYGLEQASASLESMAVIRCRRIQIPLMHLKLLRILYLIRVLKEVALYCLSPWVLKIYM